MGVATEKLVYSVSELALIFGVSEKLIYALMDKGAIPDIHIGRRRVSPKYELHKMYPNVFGGEDGIR